VDDDVVARVLRLVAKDSDDWVGLYRVLEAVADDVGGWKSLANRGWATKTTLDRFKTTACSPSASGDSARHGKEVGAPPRSPMKLEDARDLSEVS